MCDYVFKFDEDVEYLSVGDCNTQVSHQNLLKYAQGPKLKLIVPSS